MNSSDTPLKLTLIQAKEVKKLRMRGCTWRRIADEFGKAYPEIDIVQGNQLEGMALVREAGKVLGEKGIEW